MYSNSYKYINIYIYIWFNSTSGLLIYSLWTISRCALTKLIRWFSDYLSPIHSIRNWNLSFTVSCWMWDSSELQNVFVFIIFSFFSISFHIACKETNFSFRPQDSNSKAPFLQPCVFPLFPFTSKEIRLTLARVSPFLHVYCSSEYIL